MTKLGKWCMEKAPLLEMARNLITFKKAPAKIQPKKWKI
jgi:hypothetical protein